MNELRINTESKTPIEIALGIDEIGMTTARKLYEFLELNSSNYSKWYKTNITENEFATENEDYFYSSLSTSEQGRGNFAQDFKLTASFAKKLSMLTKNEKGEQARNYFIKVEDKLKEVASMEQSKKSSLDILELEFKAIKEVNSKIDLVNEDLQQFKQDLPILGVEESKITNAVRRKGMYCLGGKESNSYKDKSLRGKVYSDIYGQLKRQFGVDTYKAIKRSQCAIAIKLIENYELPFALNEKIENYNQQLILDIGVKQQSA